MADDKPLPNQEQERDGWKADLDWIADALKKLPVWERNPQLCETLLHDILPQWRKEFSSEEELNNPWTKIRKRIVKELNESEPFIEAVCDIVNNDSSDDAYYTIVDLCSGFGIFSMLLSELLPKDRVDKIWLLDKQFPPDFDNVGSQHISVKHFQRKQQQQQWRIPLQIRKVDLKKGREIKQLHKYVLGGDGDEKRKIIIVGIHLCKSLSVRAIQLYQSCPNAVALLLKPCCLPGKRNLYAPAAGRTPIVYEFANGYSFRILDLYQEEEEKCVADGDDDGSSDDTKENEEDAGCCGEKEDESAAQARETQIDSQLVFNNPHQDSNFTNERFSQWVQHLCKGCEGEKYNVQVKQVHIQSKHFQNQFIFCETLP